MSLQIQNVFDAIHRFGHDEDFQPQVRPTWLPTDAIAGSSKKIEILRHRVELGVPLFHPNDNPERMCAKGGFHVPITTTRMIKLHKHGDAMLSE